MVKRARQHKSKIKKIVPKGWDPRQTRYKQNRLMGMNITNAARVAGYSEVYARKKAASTRMEREVKVGIYEEFERAGATDKVMARELTKIALHAKKRESCEVYVEKNDDGELVVTEKTGKIEVPDEHLRANTWETIAKIKKHLTSASFLPPTGYSKMTIVLEKDAVDAGNTNQPNEKTVNRVALAD